MLHQQSFDNEHIQSAVYDTNIDQLNTLVSYHKQLQHLFENSWYYKTKPIYLEVIEIHVWTFLVEISLQHIGNYDLTPATSPSHTFVKQHTSIRTSARSSLATMLKVAKIHRYTQYISVTGIIILTEIIPLLIQLSW